MSIVSLENTNLSILFSELQRKPAEASLETFLLESSPHKYQTLTELVEVFPGWNSNGFKGEYWHFCREFLFHWIIKTDPALFRSAHFGRKVVMDAVLAADRDLHDIFRHALLLGEFEPGSAIEEWWNNVSDLARSRSGESSEDGKHTLGRKGELIVFNHERKLCSDLAPDLKPELVSFEDNFKGWDITTYRNGAAGPRKLYLEVKTTSTDRDFFISWREARRAKVLGEAWKLVVVSEPRLEVFYFPASCLLPIVPYPEYDGVSWSDCQIPMSLLPFCSACYSFQISVT
jgi:hypothetical protein